MDRTILRRMAAFLCLAALLAANGFACFAGDSFDLDRDNLPYTGDWDAYTYDEEYYGQLRGQGASINFYNWVSTSPTAAMTSSTSSPNLKI